MKTSRFWFAGFRLKSPDARSQESARQANERALVSRKPTSSVFSRKPVDRKGLMPGPRWLELYVLHLE